MSKVEELEDSKKVEHNEGCDSIDSDDETLCNCGAKQHNDLCDEWLEVVKEKRDAFYFLHGRYESLSKKLGVAITKLINCKTEEDKLNEQIEFQRRWAQKLFEQNPDPDLVCYVEKGSQPRRVYCKNCNYVTHLSKGTIRGCLFVEVEGEINKFNGNETRPKYKISTRDNAEGICKNYKRKFWKFWV